MDLMAVSGRGNLLRQRQSDRPVPEMLVSVELRRTLRFQTCG